jgi:hypothetical protein
MSHSDCSALCLPGGKFGSSGSLDQVLIKMKPKLIAQHIQVNFTILPRMLLLIYNRSLKNDRSLIDYMYL